MCILSSAMDGSDFDSNANPASPVGARIWRGFLIFQCFGMAMQIDFAQRNLGWKPIDTDRRLLKKFPWQIPQLSAPIRNFARQN
ncbi:MAG: hypothetical protein NC095_12200 [Muribaculum sp.]|nr:hypothetical protein [Muribaculum sp.]